MRTKADIYRISLWMTLFAIAMAFLESAVVVYLRALYYPGGFAFPLQEMSPVLATTELFRELATMVMLASIAAIATKRFAVGVAWFIYAFAIWDIFYYIFLYLLIGWPASLFTWDILFLLPVMWVGPVLAPLLNSVTMILLAVVIVRASETHEKIRLKGIEWILLISGSIITIIGYTMDYMHYMLGEFSFWHLVTRSDYQSIMMHSASYVPVHFSWWVFTGGEILFIIAIILFIRRYFFRNTEIAK
jgi:hypothetical protein